MGQRGCFLGTSQYVVLDMNVTIINSFIKIQDFFPFMKKITIIFVLGSQDKNVVWDYKELPKAQKMKQLKRWLVVVKLHN